MRREDRHMRTTKGLAMVATAIVAAACGEVPIPSSSVPLPSPVEAPSRPSPLSSPTPISVVGTIPPLDCELIAGSSIDYASGLTGVPDIVAATVASAEVEHMPDDQIVV